MAIGIRRSTVRSNGSWIRSRIHRAAVLAGSATLVSILLPSRDRQRSAGERPSDEPEGHRGPGEQALQRDRQPGPAVRQPADSAEPGARRGQDRPRDGAARAEGAGPGPDLGGPARGRGLTWWAASTRRSSCCRARTRRRFLDRASIMLQLQHQQGSTVSLLATATAAANRATADRDPAGGQGQKAHRRDEQEGRADPGQGKRAQQRRVQPGAVHLPTDRALTRTSGSRATRLARRRCRFALSQIGEALRLGRGRARTRTTARAW